MSKARPHGYADPGEAGRGVQVTPAAPAEPTRLHRTRWNHGSDSTDHPASSTDRVDMTTSRACRIGQPVSGRDGTREETEGASHEDQDGGRP